MENDNNSLNDDPIILGTLEEISNSFVLAKLMFEKIVEGINTTRHYREKSHPNVNISWAQRTINQIDEIAKSVIHHASDKEFDELKYEFIKIKGELRFYIMEERKRVRPKENFTEEILDIEIHSTCPFCGDSLPLKSRFCKKCGTELLGFFTFSN